jgi:hypothetical protein
MNCNDEDLLDIITKQRLTIYHQERRIEALEKSLSQATNPTMTNDLVNQLFNQLQTSNELMALKARCERLSAEKTLIFDELQAYQSTLDKYAMFRNEDERLIAKTALHRLLEVFTGGKS